MDASQRLRLARRRSGLSQAQLALRVGVQRSAVSHWEAADGKSPNMAHLREVAIVTAVQFEWLATGRGEMQPPSSFHLDSVSAVAGILIDDDVELRLIRCYRNATTQARVLLIELAEFMVVQRKESRRKKLALEPS